MRVFKGVAAKNWLLDTLLDSFSMLGMSFSVACLNVRLSERVILWRGHDVMKSKCVGGISLTSKLVSAP